MRFSNVIIASCAAGLALAAPLGLETAHADGKASRPDVMPVDQLKRGMKGYGLTVFEGTKPEKFDVEIIDVLYNFRPRQELILVKTTHPRLEVAKVVAGMSGSPVYINGKMVGAYAYGWTFGVEPVAGVTPIKSMLDDIERPLPKSIHGWPLKLLPKGKQAKASPGLTKNRYAGDLGQYDVEAHAKQIARAKRAVGPTAGSPVTTVATPLLVGGMTPGAIDTAKQLFAPLGLEPLQAGGGGKPDPNAPTRYVDGGAIGVQLIRGDMSGMGLGTVTRVEGDRLVGFGHPMMFAGVTALPTAVGKVLWFLASDMRSFKIGLPARPVGALVNDRLASIVVSHSAQAPTIPVSMKVKGAAGAPYTQWDFEVAHEKFMAPSFISVALGNALQATAAERQDVSWTAKSKLKVKGQSSLDIEDFGVSVGGTPSPRDFVRSNLVRSVGALLNNPWKPAFIEGVEVEVELRYAREIFRIRGAEILDPEVEAGEPARIRLTLLPFSGEPVTKVISVPLPKHLAGRTLTLSIEPGYQKTREQAAPERYEDLVRNLQNPLYRTKSIVVSYNAGSGAVAFKGRVAKNLPPGALDMIRPRSSSVAPAAFQTEARHVFPVANFVTGKDRVQVKVKKVMR